MVINRNIWYYIFFKKSTEFVVLKAIQNYYCCKVINKYAKNMIGWEWGIWLRTVRCAEFCEWIIFLRKCLTHTNYALIIYKYVAKKIKIMKA